MAIDSCNDGNCTLDVPEKAELALSLIFELTEDGKLLEQVVNKYAEGKFTIPEGSFPMLMNIIQMLKPLL